MISETKLIDVEKITRDVLGNLALQIEDKFAGDGTPIVVFGVNYMKKLDLIDIEIDGALAIPDYFRGIDMSPTYTTLYENNPLVLRYNIPATDIYPRMYILFPVLTPADMNGYGKLPKAIETVWNEKAVEFSTDFFNFITNVKKHEDPRNTEVFGNINDEFIEIIINEAHLLIFGMLSVFEFSLDVWETLMNRLEPITVEDSETGHVFKQVAYTEDTDKLWKLTNMVIMQLDLGCEFQDIDMFTKIPISEIPELNELYKIDNDDTGKGNFLYFNDSVCFTAVIYGEAIVPPNTEYEQGTVLPMNTLHISSPIYRKILKLAVKYSSDIPLKDDNEAFHVDDFVIVDDIIMAD